MSKKEVGKKEIREIMNTAINKAAECLKEGFGDILTKEQINAWWMKSAQRAWGEIDRIDSILNQIDEVKE